MNTAITYCLVAMALTAPWREYDVYAPRIERTFVVNFRTIELKYNHVSSIAWFGDRWFCVWNANDVPAEGEPGQLNYCSTSHDGKVWTRPKAAFSDPDCCANPIPCPKGTQWQPNLIVVGDELWAVWSQNSRDEHFGCYVSRLSDPDGKWVNRRLTWDGSERVTVDGKSWRLFPSQNPIELKTGRILAPVTMMGPKASDAPEGVESWWATEKRDSVLYTDDRGATWKVSPGAVQPGRSWAQWEPTVWELPDGRVMMFARNNDFRTADSGGPRPAQMLTWSISQDGGATWTPHEYAPLETVASRMHVLPCGENRFVMVHNDWPADRFVADRKNLALFFTRGKGIDFVAGPGISGFEPVVAYPQMFIRNDRLLVSYSQGNQLRSIKCAIVSPLPKPDRYYIFPRNNLPPSETPLQADGVLRFMGAQHVETTRPVVAGEKAFSAGMLLRPTDNGMLLDTRFQKSKGGFVWALRGELQPFFHACTKEHNIVSSLDLAPLKWNYAGLSVNSEAGAVEFHVNGKMERLKFTTPLPGPLSGNTGHIGAKRIAHSAVPGFVGDIGSFFLLRDRVLSVEEHHAMAEWLQTAEGAKCPVGGMEDVLLFRTADKRGLGDGFRLPPERSEGIRRLDSGGASLLEFTGESSAGLDLDENDRAAGDGVELEFKFRIERGDTHVLCTVGDANAPARVIAYSGSVWLESYSNRIVCGRTRPGVWSRLGIRTSGRGTRARLDNGPWVHVAHDPVATWAYLGQGYRTGCSSPDDVFSVDVKSARSRITHSH